MSWAACYRNILPYVFSIETPEGSGTGVFFMYNAEHTIGAVATAAHVIEHAHNWNLPIKLRQHSTKKEMFLNESDRFIYTDKRHDSASILFPIKTFDLPSDVLPIMPATRYKSIGIEVGWVGYPCIAQPDLCLGLM